MAPDVVHVVDDDAGVRDSVAFLLGTDGFEVRLYEAGAELLDRLAKPAFGAVLTDIRMPGIDGLELLRRLRATGHTLPVVMMTGHGDVPLAVEAMKLGACDFIEKPFGDEALIQALRSALERGGPAEAADLDCRTSSGGPAPERAGATGVGPSGRRRHQQGDRARPRHQPAHRGDLPGQAHGQDAGCQPPGTGTLGGPRRHGVTRA